MQSTSELKWNSPTALLDVAWSLAVLDKLDSNLAQSVLNDTYLINITSKQMSCYLRWVVIFSVTYLIKYIFLAELESTNNSNVGDTLKVNQLWALATLKEWKMNGMINKLSWSTYNLNV